ncbi:hypothetical protein [Kitasatospora sp. GP82]|uniref:hypothetical protein n=1 Tax=Kitasatospora sp. GP82 TaxID=3035089 RepID=UPI002473A42C|nr:hypothetical protein [Kitasatospora sp. GP82]MDH6128870.1 hypothetical protein [Kitasatospora sp. GP82]
MAGREGQIEALLAGIVAAVPALVVRAVLSGVYASLVGHPTTQKLLDVSVLSVWAAGAAVMYLRIRPKPPIRQHR